MIDKLIKYNQSASLPPESEMSALMGCAFSLLKEGQAQDVSVACAFLTRAAKKAAYRKEINAAFAEREPLYRALTGELPKLRKNAARLLGALGDERDSDALIAALSRESARMVRPSLLLSLGACGGDASREFLTGYKVSPATDLSEEKHVREETEALATARDKLTPKKPHLFTGLTREEEVELRVPQGLATASVEELTELGFAPYAVKPDRVRVKTESLLALYQARSFFELLFPLSIGLPLRPNAAASCAERLIALMQSAHEGTPPYRYRLELKGYSGDRPAFLKEAAAAISEKAEELINSVSGYECELRLEVRRDAPLMDAYLRLYTYEDTRFSYRKHALPASMHPATAAAILKYADKYLSVNARVLDPCCGSGTFLIERSMLSPCQALTGVDISGKACDISRENSRLAECPAKFVHNDFLRFTAKRPYDEVIANLPFGNRVGNHKQNERLYAGLAAALPDWLRPGGTAILYTMEHTLLTRCLKAEKRLMLLERTRTEAGGLTPGIFILKRR